ncbi:MAG: formylglycine-generating enzyme family protein, partial [Bacteroidota bacterium]
MRFKIIFYYTLVFSGLTWFCVGCKNKSTPSENIAALEQVDEMKVASAIVCTKIGLVPNDSVLYMKGGGKDFEPSIVNNAKPSAPSPQGMVYIPGGEFSMGGVNPVGMNDGGKEGMDDARPVHRVYVDPFYMDETEVTNAQYAAFVKATGYVTVAEKAPTKEEFPDVAPENLVAGSAVFTAPANKVALDNYTEWWTYMHGANWKHPTGANSSIEGKDNFPVVQIAWEDAAAYAKWAGKRLPTEAEWEFAARGGAAGELYTWGNQIKPDNKWQANIFQGSFPDKDLGADGFVGVAPVKSFASNKYDLYDMAGNVWEWCSDWYQASYYQTLKKDGVARNPTGPATSLDPNEPGLQKKVNRGGSFLCTDQ